MSSCQHSAYHQLTCCSAKSNDSLFIHYRGHRARLLVETNNDDNTGCYKNNFPCDMNLILDENFWDFVDSCNNT
ncbi:hypothetical protein KSP39_PZI009865 [Platanthera zijinensis]|uniref:Uncharacterized protein n=1 Tax=Platanthera zijinensis TaxID=2320716 RepID=A0AAP0BIU5_9ASPA